ncbi:hypothetical protein VKT23_011481 [Stygiomarasmius scandens]|uniref:Uncharacterized protein n=1 Tax=Marasmiellus scandens TaxID=2682957 RepID=A0ABR1JDX2_9AGAR
MQNAKCKFHRLLADHSPVTLSPMELEPAQCQIHLWFDPQMRLWEKEESHLRLMNRQEGTDITHPVPVTIHDLQEGEKAWDDPDAYRVYHVRRFFDTMEGFYTGELDLTGRYQLRFDDLLSLHAKFMWDMARVREIAHKIKYKVKKRDGTTEIDICYEIADQDIYDDFRLRWKIPRVVGFSWLEDRIGWIKRYILHKELPRYNISVSPTCPRKSSITYSRIPLLDKVDRWRQLQSKGKPWALDMFHMMHSRTLKLELSSKDFDNAEGMDECEKATFYAKLASEMRHKLILVTDFLLSHQVIQERSRALFSTLQRLALSKVDSWQVPSLIRWVNSRPSHICTLTHVKLEMVWGLSDDVAIDFVESLDSAPLQVLVLEGIETGSITLIDRIAQIFPDLLGLTLVRRESNRQIKTKMCRWPRPCWEYAARFGSFRRLEYFGWNFAVGISDCLTPAALLLLGKIVQGMDPDEAEEEVWRFIHEDCLRKEEEIVAVVRPFAAVSFLGDYRF